MATKFPIEEFIRRCNILYSEQNFDYSKVQYSELSDLITVVCPQHGEFQVKMGTFIKGHSQCPKCKKRPIWSESIFIELSNAIYGEQYTILGQYEGAHDKIEIYCKKHEHSFKVTPTEHVSLSSGGCKHCRSEIQSQIWASKRKYSKEFIEDLYITKNLEISEIMEIFGCGWGTVYHYINLYNLPHRTTHKEIDDSEVIRLFFEENLSGKWLLTNLV